MTATTELKETLAFEETIATLEAKLEAAEKEINRLRPDTDIRDRLFDKPADVKAYFSRQYLIDMAYNEWAKENRARRRDGRLDLPPLTEDELDAEIDRICQVLVDKRTRNVPAIGPMPRAIKMVRPDGHMVPVPFEAHINNLRYGDRAISMFRDRGWKLTDPYICQAQPCNEPAEVDSQGRFTFNGYCSKNHLDRTEPTGPQGGDPDSTVVRGRFR